MLIDSIIDRKDGANIYHKIQKEGKVLVSPKYSSKNLYDYLIGFGDLYGDIVDLLDSGENEDIQKALCLYIIEGGYNTDLCEYIKSVKWV